MIAFANSRRKFKTFLIVCFAPNYLYHATAQNDFYRVEQALLGGLYGDALALGGHYEYDAKKIREHVGSYEKFHSPGEGMGGKTHGVGWGSANYHPGKRAGDLTDAGEVAIMLLEHIANKKSYTFDEFSRYWKQQIDEGYGSCNFQSVRGNDCPPGLKPGYLNGATRRTLQALQQYPDATGDFRMSLAADVNCLVSATHFLPLFLLPEFAADEDKAANAAISTVFLSHKNRDPVAAAEFLARSLHRILFKAMPIEEALESTAAAMKDDFISRKLKEAKAKVIEATDTDSALSKEPFVDDLALTSLARLWDVGKSEPIKVGKASPTEGALPGALYFVLKYKHSLRDALIANANVGGDSGNLFMIGSSV